MISLEDVKKALGITGDYLDDTLNFYIEEVNFLLKNRCKSGDGIFVDVVIYDIYADPRLKSFRNVGIMFYPYEKYYMGLLFLQIKLSSDVNYIVPENNVIYNNITHIRFQRIIPRYVPYFVKPFYLKYRLFNNENTNLNVKNNLSSNMFFPNKIFPIRHL